MESRERDTLEDEWFDAPPMPSLAPRPPSLPPPSLNAALDEPDPLEGWFR